MKTEKSSSKQEDNKSSKKRRLSKVKSGYKQEFISTSFAANSNSNKYYAQERKWKDESAEAQITSSASGTISK